MGCGERIGNANLVTIIANLQLKFGFPCCSREQLARLTETAHLVDEILNRTPNPPQPYVGKQRLRAQGRHARRRRQRRRGDLRTHRPPLVGNERELLVSELAGRASVLEKAARLGIDLDEDGARARARARQGARAPRLPVRGGRRLARAAAAQRGRRYEPLFTLESWRVIVEQRADGERRDRGHDQDLDRRRAPRHAPPRATAPSTRSTPRCAPRSARSTPSRRHRARQLQGADPRRGQGHRRRHARVLLDSSDGPEVWGSIGVSENVIAASWEALGRLARARHARRARRRERRGEIPLARPVLGEEEERAVLEVLRSGGSRSGRCCRRVRARLSPRSVGRGVRERCLERHRWPASGAARGRREDGDEVVTSPFSFVASANAIVYERARPVFVDIDPLHAEPRPDAAAAAVGRAHAALLPVHIFGWPADMRGVRADRGQHGLPIVEDACEALGARHADGGAVGGRAATRPCSGSMPTSS